MEVVVCLGDPVVDIVAKVEPHFLSLLDITPGGCVPVDSAQMESLLAQLQGSGEPIKRVGGGSAANVSKGMAQLGLCHNGRKKTAFAGRVGGDKAGRDYTERLERLGVLPRLCCSNDSPTATCLCLVTPDGQRSMRTCLAAAAELSAVEQLGPTWLNNCYLLHMEGYVMYRPTLAFGAVRAAQAAGALRSIDLASFELVRNCHTTLTQLLHEGGLDLVFCNEEEAQALAEVAGLSMASKAQTIDAAQTFLLRRCKVSIVSLGPEGCVARDRAGRRVECQPPNAEVVDTIGAGDSFTAGFLHAYLAGASLEACGQCACLVGAASVQSAGAELSAAVWEGLRHAVDDICRMPAQRTEAESAGAADEAEISS